MLAPESIESGEALAEEGGGPGEAGWRQTVRSAFRVGLVPEQKEAGMWGEQGRGEGLCLCPAQIRRASVGLSGRGTSAAALVGGEVQVLGFPSIPLQQLLVTLVTRVSDVPAVRYRPASVEH